MLECSTITTVFDPVHQSFGSTPVRPAVRRGSQHWPVLADDTESDFRQLGRDGPGAHTEPGPQAIDGTP